MLFRSVLLSSLAGAAVLAAREAVVALYTRDGAVVAAALPLLAFVAVFHVADATQTIAAFVLRAWRIATLPLVINTAALWGVGLGGGYALAFGAQGAGARGFWTAATVGLSLTALALAGLLAHATRRHATA